ncbi:MAG: hypothetical protein KAT16_04285 [Candidatus Heimdallarchaeota archaeon]|nr:hypothetical protein [Candidatus Heimdallarchaeota archaeon]
MYASRYNEAEILLNDILRRDPKQVKSKVNLSTVYQATDRLAEAASELLEALKIDENLPENEKNPKLSDPGAAWYRLNIIFAKLGQFDLAGQAILKANSYPLTEDGQQLILEGLKTGAAMSLLHGKLLAAEDGFKSVLKYDPKYTNSHIGLGTIYTLQKKLDLAEEHLDEAFQLDPKNPQIFHNLGFIKLNTERVEQAEDDFKTAIKLDPKYAMAWASLMLVLSKRQKKEELISTFNTAIQELKGDITRLEEFESYLRKNELFQYADEVLEAL